MENSVFRGISNSKLDSTFAHWYSFCEEWIYLTEKCSRLLDGDSSYSHNELGNVALLSAAIFRSGWIALSESITEKNGNARLGRADLYVTNEVHDDAIEAKICWIDIDGSQIPRIVKQHELAVHDAKKIDKSYYSGIIAVTFVVPWFNKLDSKTEKIEKSKKLQESVMEIRFSNKNMIIAWCFPDFGDIIEDKIGNLFHGVIVIVEKI